MPGRLGVHRLEGLPDAAATRMPTLPLQEALGGNAKTTFIGTVSPSSLAARETASTLAFLRRAKCVVNRPVIKVDVTGDKGALALEIQRCGGGLGGGRR